MRYVTIRGIVICLLLTESVQQHSPALAYAHLKLLWEMDEEPREKTLQHLAAFCIDFARSVGFADPNEVIQGNRDLIEKSRYLLAKAYMKQGDWRKGLAGEWTPVRLSSPSCHPLAESR
jgi:FAT domain